MILVVGGAYQGKTEFVKQTLGIAKKNAMFNAHNIIKAYIERGEDPEQILEIIEKNNIAAVTADEIGMGIVPLDKNDRIWRERTGRIICRIAAMADEVYRLCAGIPTRIK